MQLHIGWQHKILFAILFVRKLLKWWCSNTTTLFYINASHSVCKSCMSVSYCSNQAHHRHHMADRWDHTYSIQNSPCGILGNFEVKPKSSKNWREIFVISQVFDFDLKRYRNPQKYIVYYALTLKDDPSATNMHMARIQSSKKSKTATKTLFDIVPHNPSVLMLNNCSVSPRLVIIPVSSASFR